MDEKMNVKEVVFIKERTGVGWLKINQDRKPDWFLNIRKKKRK
jgi:hypothetical protein